MSVQLIEHGDGFTDLLPAWSELLQASGSRCPFLTAEWLHAWWTHLGRSRRLHLLVVRDGSLVTAIAPWQRVAGPLGLLSRLEFLGAGYAGSDYLDLIVRRGHESESLGALAASVDRHRRILRLKHLPPSSMASRLGTCLTSARWVVRLAPDGTCPVIALDGHTWESYLGSLGSAHRANVRRRLKAVGTRFDVRFDLAVSEGERRDALAALIQFHARRFAGRGSTAFLTPSLHAFHHEATTRMAERGWLRLYVLRLDERTAGVMYGFAFDNRFYFYQHGFDAAFEPFSIGLVLMGLTIRAAIEEGLVEFDMLYGTERYKWLWARDERPLTQLQLFPPRAAGMLHRRTLEVDRSIRTAARRILTWGGARAS
jgi:CelD/BcsL family acetyltransferase involved in cellulose biosynthesis